MVKKFKVKAISESAKSKQLPADLLVRFVGVNKTQRRKNVRGSIKRWCIKNHRFSGVIGGAGLQPPQTALSKFSLQT